MTAVRATEKLLNAARLGSGWLRRPQALPEKWLYALGIRSAQGLRMPDFLGIGAQRAGTTWLHTNLSCHPQVYLPPERKEIRFFDQRFFMSPTQYSRLFEPAGERITGDVTPGYAVLPKRRIRFVQRLMPDVGLILILRDPIERAWSHALLDLVTTKRRRYEEVSEWEFYAHFRAAGARRHGCYSAILERWLSVFPRRQLLVASFEDIAARPRELLTRVFRHLGVSCNVDWEGFPYCEKIHAGPELALPDAYRAFLRDLFQPELHAAAERSGDRR